MNLIQGTAGADSLVGDSAADTADSILGLGGNDTLRGLSNDDTLDGGSGTDSMEGGTGNDTYVLDVGTDIVNETLNGGGWDGVNLAFTVGAVYTLPAGVEWAQITAPGPLTINVTGNALNNNLIGGAGPNRLDGGSGDDWLDGGQGNDTLIGGVGFDWVSFVASPAGVNVNLVTGTATGFGTDSLNGIDAIQGSGFNDTLLGDANGNSFNALEGNDIVDGGAGWDWVGFWGATGPVTASLASGTASGSGIGNDLISNIEALSGGSFDDTLIGNAGNNDLEGGQGNDVLDGGAGIDRAAYWSSFGGVDVNLQTGIVLGGSGNDTLQNIEGVAGSAFNDTLTGSTGDNTFEPRSGNDLITGGAGFDQVDFRDAPGPVIANLSTGSATGDGADTLAGIEGLTGFVFNDTLTGDGNNNRLEGREGDDSLDGAAGNDTLIGGLGNDVLIGGTGNDRAEYWDAAGPIVFNAATGLLTGGAGADTLSGIETIAGGSFNDTMLGDGAANVFEGHAGNDSLVGGGGNDSLSGHQGADLLEGGDGNDQLRGDTENDTLQGGKGNDYLTGGLGNDSLVGGDGNDTADYYFDVTAAAINASLVTGLVTGGGGTDTLSGIENLNGSDFNDTLTGDAVANSLEGRGGNDSITGGAGGDFIAPGAGSDIVDGGLITDRNGYVDGNTLSYADLTGPNGIVADFSGVTGDGSIGTGTVQDGTGGTDIVANVFNFVGTNQNDSILGSGANIFEQFQGLNGNDTIDGGAIDAVLLPANANRVSYASATDPVVVDLLAGTATGANGSDTLSRINQVRGGSGNDTLLGSNDAIRAEQFEGRAGNDSIDGRGGFDMVRYDAATSAVTVDLVGGTAIDGHGSTDALANIEGAIGSGFNDSLVGNAAANRLEGRNGNDTMIGGAGNDTFEGGSGTDWVFYNNTAGAVTVNLATRVATSVDGTDSLGGVERVSGSAFADTMTGASGNAVQEMFQGNAGNDSLDGGLIVDRANYTDGNWASYATAPAAVNVNLSGITGDGSTGAGTASDGHGGTDTLKNIDFVLGSSHNDVITGSSALLFEYFEPGPGNDTVDGGVFADLTDGRASNRISYANASGAVTVDLLLGTATGADGNDVLSNFSQVQGSGFGDTLRGSDTDAWIEQFRPGVGANDSIDGRGGEDMVRYETNTSAGVTVVLAGPGATIIVNDGEGGVDTLTGIEHVRGTNFADSLGGSARTDLVERFQPQGGNDTIDGGAGQDMVLYTEAPAGVNVTIGASGSALNDGYGATDTLLGIEQVRGSFHNDVLTGSDAAGPEVFDGRQGNDTIDGRGGIDLADYYYAWYAGAVVDLIAGTASDGFGFTDTLLNVENVRGSQDFGDTLAGNALANLLDGAGGSDSLSGGAGNDTLLGGKGDDTLVGGTGTDSLVGGAGNDLYDIDALSDVIVEAADQGIDTVRLSLPSGTYTLTAANVENVVVGSGGAVNVTGSAGPNLIVGGAGNNSLAGGDGDDTIVGSFASDTIDGGTGADRLDLAWPLSAYSVVEASPTELLLTGPSGETLLVRNSIEQFLFGDGLRSFADVAALAGSSASETLVGTEGDDLLDGAGGNDSLDGLGGNDTLIGGTGTDTLNGGPGNDVFVVDLPAELGLLADAGGNDLLRLNFAAAGSVVLPAAIEHATVISGPTVAVHLVGNTGHNELIGNGAANSLTGGEGNDTLNGDLGIDTMVGGPGNDAYILNVPADVVNETAAGSDGIDAAVLRFTAVASYALPANVENGSIEATVSGVTLNGNALDNALTGGMTNDILAGQAGHDGIAGGGGNDTLLGGDGHDWLRGGKGDDSLVGGTGFNTADYEDATGGVTVNLVTGIASGPNVGTDTLSGIQQINGSVHADHVTAAAEGTYFNTRGGNDTFVGGAGNDRVVPGPGNGAFDGGESAFDFDVLGLWEATGSVVVNLAAGTVTGFGTHSITGFEGVEGSSFNDTIIGSDADETFWGGAGSDSLVGGNGFDTAMLWPGDVLLDVATGIASGPQAGTDTLVGFEQFIAADGNDTLIGDGNVNVLSGGKGNDSIVGNGGADQLIAEAGNDTLRGGDADDDLVPGAGSDLIDGGTGSDRVRFYDLPQAVHASLITDLATSGGDVDTLAGIERIEGGQYNDTLIGDENGNVLDGHFGHDSLVGNEGADTLSGQSGADTIDGGEGNDLLFGQADNDTLLGGAGNDTLFGGKGNDSLVGGDGIDWAEYSGGETTSGVNVNLTTGAVGGGAGTDTVSGVENVGGSDFNDTFTGDGNANTLDGRGGNDSLLGGGGNDSLFGGDGNDTIRGEGGGDFVRGNAGNDSLDGGLVLDRVNYTDGNSLSFTDATGPVAVNLSGITGDGSAGTGTAQDGRGGTDTVANFNFYTLGASADTFLGSSALQFEHVEGGAGNDTLDGGAMLDTLLQRDGNRISYAGATSAVVVDLAAGTATGGAGSDTLANFNQVRGSDHADTLRGSDRTDYTELFEGRGGNDSIDGRGGFDMLRYDASPVGVNVNLVTGVASDGHGGTDSFANIEGVFGSALADVLTGGRAAAGTNATDITLSEVFRPNGGNDTVDGGQGYDIVEYRSSTQGVNVKLNDTAPGSASDGVLVNGVQGTDVLLNIEAARGSDFNDTLTGSDTAPLEGFEGRAGNDGIDGRGGLDLVSYRASPAGVNVNLTTGVATDGFGGTDALLNIEWVRGSRDANDTLTGSAAANTLEGFGGNDSLNGAAGDDRLEAGTGVDTVDGGADSDTLIMLAPFADYSVARPNATDVVLVNVATLEHVTLRNVELVQFSDGVKTLAEVIANAASGQNDSLTGDNDDDFFDGLAGNDTIVGLGGNDTLIGGVGTDSLVGGPGNDVYGVDVIVGAADVVVELDGEGTDRVNVGPAAAAVYTLPANVENATVVAGPTIAVGLTGNALANELVGNAAANVLLGQAGNDTLDGGLGNDTMAGGAGDDVYVLNVPTDVVNETAPGSDGTDRVDLNFAAVAPYTLGPNVENARVTTGFNINVVGNALINDLQGGLGNNSLSGLDGDDRLDGDQGNDTLDGGAGGDWLIGGKGNDQLIGGAGTDEADYSAIGGPILVNLATGSASGAGGDDTLSGIEQVVGTDYGDTLIGSAGDDAFYGMGGNDSLVGGDGADVLDGQDGQATLIGGAGNDLLFTGALGNDLIDGGADHDLAYYDRATGSVVVNLAAGTATGAGTDTLIGIEGVRGGDFSDTLIGDGADNEMQGGKGADSIVGGAGIDLVRYTIEQAAVNANLLTGIAVTSTGNDTLSGIENLRGGSFDDTLVGDNNANHLRGGFGGNDSLVGNGGNDTLDGEQGIDTLAGGLGNDTLIVHGGNEVLVENAGEGQDVAVVQAWAPVNFTLPANVEDGRIEAGDGFAVTLNGNNLNNVLTGGALADAIFGGQGDDTLAGGGGNDTLQGNEQVEIDFVDYRTATGAATINLLTGTATAPGHGTDVLSGLEGVFATPFNDSITGGSAGGVYFFQPGAGNDTIVGNSGFDVVDYTDSPNPIVFTSTGLNAGTATGFGTDTFSGIDGLYGSNHNDSIRGGAANERIRPRGGNDTADGAGGFDTIDYRTATAAVLVNLAAGTATGGDGTDTLLNFENARGSLSFNDTLIGDEGSNILDGLGGNDSLSGAGGDDTLAGSAGNDTIDGGDEWFADMVDMRSAIGGSVVNLVTGTATGDGSDVLIDIEGVWGSVAADSITGNDAPFNYFWPNAGDDTVHGGGGLDLLSFDTQASPVTVVFTAPGSGTATGGAPVGTDSFTGIEYIVGGAGADTMVGSTGDDTFRANGGNDSLDGGAGSDTADYWQAVGGVAASLLTNSSSGPDGVDTLISIENLAGSQLHNDTLTGNAAANRLDGRGGNDSLVGNGGDDTLVAGTGVDTVDGGDGSDTVEVLGAFAAYTVTRPNASDVRLVNAATGENITMRGVDAVLFSDGLKSIVDVLGNIATALNDTLVGTPGDDLIDGLAGNDSISGLGGRDTLVGGAGNDTLIGGPGDDVYGIDAATDQVVEADGEGTDLVNVGFAAAAVYPLPANVENATVVSGPTVAVGLTGNALANQLIGNGAANSLVGGDGNDTLDGGLGNDTMAGGAGNDVYVLNVPTDVVNETAPGSDGFDAVELAFAAVAPYSLPANVEGARVLGALNINVVGNALDNDLQGGAGNNSLSGGLGNDTLIGEAGNDTLDGGDGDDTFSGGAGNDAIVGGAGINDHAEYALADAGIQANLATGLVTGGAGSDTLSGIEWLTATPFNDTVIGSAAANFIDARNGNDSVSGGDGNDYIVGGGGDDTLEGGTGDDFLFTGPGGNDLVIGGDGSADIVFYDDVTAAVQVNLATGIVTGATAGSDTLSGVEGVRGSDFNDTLIGTAGDDIFDGNDGADSIAGGGGSDLARFSVETAGVNVSLATGLAATSTGTDTLGGIEHLRGSAHNDTLTGDAGPNHLRGGSGGNDSLVGGGGDDTLDGEWGNDTLQGGTGNDTLIVHSGAELVTESAGQGQDVAVVQAWQALVSFTLPANVEDGRIEDVAGFAATLIGNAQPNVLTGSALADALQGDAGDDTLVGGTGNDTLDGGAGTLDVADYRGAVGAVAVSLVTNSASGAAGSDVLANIEAVLGTLTFNDTLIGNAGANRLEGFGGNDSLAGNGGDDTLVAGTGVDTADGGDGTDTLLVQGPRAAYTITRPNATDIVFVNPGTGENITTRNVDAVQFSDGLRTMVDLLGSTPSPFNDTLLGTPGDDLVDGLAGNDSISGLGGHDTLVGGTGIDTLVGGPGNDVYGVDAATDQVVELDGEGMDRVNVGFAAAAMYTLPANVEHATVVSGPTVAVGLTGNALDNELAGNGAANNLVGGEGNDTLIGGAGNDTLAGGAGDDVYVLDVATDVVNETAPGSDGVDRVDLAFGIAAPYALGANVENARVISGLAINVVGNALHNRLEGGAGNNSLSGGLGFDTLLGDAGNDTLDGGDGNDILDGGAGNDSIVGGAGDADHVVYNLAGAGVNVNLATGLVSGGAGSDTITGVEYLTATDFADTLTGSAAANYIQAGFGHDSLAGGDGNDTLHGAEGDDTLEGGSGNDYLITGPAGNDLVIGGEGIDIVDYNGVSAGVQVNLATGVVTGATAGSDTLSGLEGVRGTTFNDTLIGTTGDDIFDGNDGADSIVGGGGGIDLVRYTVHGAGVNASLATGLATTATGVDTLAGIENLEGSNWNDTLVGDGNANHLRGRSGHDSLVGGGGSDTLEGDVGNDTLQGGTGNDTFIVHTGAELVIENAGEGQDVAVVQATQALSFTLPANVEDGRIEDFVGLAVTLVGNGLPNVLTGSTLADSMQGDAGDDTLAGGAGNDTLDGGSHVDFDFVDYRGATGGAVVNLAAGTGTAAGQGNDVLIAIEGVIGSAFNDNVTAGAGPQYFFQLGAGNDTVTGGAGFDIVDYRDSPNPIVFAPTGNLAGIATGFGTDVYTAVEALFGSHHNDTLTGSAGNETLRPQRGDDVVAGGAGTDRVDYREATAAVAVNLATGLASGADGNDTLTGIENVRGSLGFNDTLVGDDNRNLLDGMGGNDALSGAGGDDTFVGAAGNDTLDGGSQSLFDHADYTAAGNAVIVDLGAGTATGVGTDTLIDIEGVWGSAFDDALTGSAVSNLFWPNLGNDTVAGGDGNDVLAYDNQNTAVSVQFSGVGSGTASGLGDDVFTGIEIVLGSRGADLMTGGAGNETLHGNEGNDTLDGGAGSMDVADYRNASGAVTVSLLSNTSSGAAGNDVLLNIEGLHGTLTFGDTLVGNAGANRLDGRGGNDSLVGNGGDDTLVAGTGVDTVDGGDGNDTLQVPGALAAYTITRPNASDIVFVNAAAGENVTARNIDAVQFGDGLRTMQDLLGSTASPFNDTLVGTAGDDAIDGLAGNDGLSGLGGHDTLIGGSGNDTLAGGPGNDVYGVDVAADQVVEVDGEGIDRVNVGFVAAAVYTLPANVENATVVSGPAIAVGLTGNALANTLVGNAAANNLIGGDGNDTLDGGLGNDVMAGGAGNDVYVLDVTTDVVNETAPGSDGVDRVDLAFAAAVAYALGANVENARVLAGLNINVTGNALANELQGGAGNNSLVGLAGDDTFVGSGGTDSMAGGDGTDLLKLAGAAGDWTVSRPTAAEVQFSSLAGTVRVSTVELVQFGNDAPVSITSLIDDVGSPFDDTLSGGAGEQHLAGGAGNDSIDGGAGNDTLLGEAGNDTLLGGEGADVMDGGDGSDTYRIALDGGLDVIEQNDSLAGSLDAILLPVGVVQGELQVSRGFASFDDLVVTIQDGATTQQVVVAGFFNGEVVRPGAIDQLRLADGTVLTALQLAQLANAFDGGNHVFVGLPGNDTLNGDQAGADTPDWISGGGGNDNLSGAGGQDTLFGGAGNDLLLGGGGNDRLAGGGADDTLDGGAGNDTLSGGSGNDRYAFGAGSGSDLVVEAMVVTDWTAALDSGVGPVYQPGDGDQPRNTDIDVLAIAPGVAPAQLKPSRIGDDLVLQIEGGGDQVRVSGYFAPGVTTIELISFANGTSWSSAVVRSMLIQPTAGADTIVGYSGADNLAGLGGNDVIDGREGNDTLAGGDGADTLTGGSGSDRFVFSGPGALTATDTIADFVPGLDKLVLSAATFTSLTAGSTLDPDTDPFIDYNPTTGALTYDADGAGGAAPVVIALLGVGTHPASLGLDIVVTS